jgi:putative CocE/NonD family hydrolase
VTSVVTIERGVGIPMSDGTVLAADVHRAGEAPRPVLLQRTPYDRGNVIASYVWGLLEPNAAIDAGFTVVIQDVRGRWGSEGRFEPFAAEARDGADTIAWLREQPWCDGRVGMYGMSYVGSTQLLAAGESPEGLFAIAPALTAADYYDGWVYEGGMLALGFALFWTLIDLAPHDIARRSAAASDVERWNSAIADMLANPAAAFASVPQIVDELAPWFAQWREHPLRDPFWSSTSPRNGRRRTAVPALHFGGWYDLFLSGTLENYRELSADAATSYARDNQRLIVGPWAHGNLSDTVGDLHFGLGAALASLDLNRLHLDFFRAALAGEPVPGPAVRVFVLGADRWSDEDAWPPRDATPQTYGLTESGALVSGTGSGVRGFVHDPGDPAPTTGGRTFLPGLLSSHNAGTKDQARALARADGLTFVSAPLARPLLVIGDVSLSLTVTTEGTDIDIVATLLDIHPDGRAFNLCEGARRASATGVHIIAGEPAVLDVDLSGIAVEFRAGHRIGIRIAGASWPRLDVGDNGTGAAATITLLLGEAALILPVRAS